MATQENTKREFMNLNRNIEVLRVVGQDGKIACELTFERFVKGYNKDTKKCEWSMLNLKVLKPVDTKGEEMKLVKRYTVGVKQASNIIWVEKAQLDETKKEIESV